MGVWMDIPTDTLLLRSFIAFLGIETLLVFIAVVYIKMTEKMRVEEEEYEEEEREEMVTEE